MAEQYFATGFEAGNHTIIWDINTFLRLQLHTIKQQDDLKAIAWSMRGFWPSAIEKITVEVVDEVGNKRVKMTVFIKEGRERDCIDMRKGR